MWIQFAAAFLTIGVILYLPGALGLFAIGQPVSLAFVGAPVFTLLLLSIEAEAYAAVGIAATWESMLSPFAVIALMAMVKRYFLGRRYRRNGGRWFLRKTDWMSLLPVLAYIGVGVLTITMIFVKNLDGPDSIFLAVDNVSHQGRVKIFLESQNYSSFGRNLYYSSGLETVAAPFDYSIPSSSFYPSEWHILAALTVDLLGVSIPLVTNALNAFLAGVVWPVSMFGLLSVVFSGKRSLVWAGSLTTMALGAFPWGYLVFGPLYPNLLSYALAPVAVSQFISIFADKASRSTRAKHILLFVFSLIVLALAQTNAVFLLAVILAPFCISQAARIGDLPIFIRASRRWRRIFFSMAVICIAFIWLAIYSAPFVKSVVEFNWPSTYSTVQSVVNVLTLGLTPRTSAQPVMALLVLWGGVVLLRDRERRWVVGSYAFAVVIYIFGVSTEGILKHVLSGFWYTDSYRIAASVAICAVPIAAAGLDDLVRRAFSFANARWPSFQVERTRVFAAIVVCSAVFLIAVFFPNYQIPGYADVTTAFGNVRHLVWDQNNTQNVRVLDADEMDFFEEVENVVPEGALVINQPNDGSAFLFSDSDVNLYYRYLQGYGGSDELEDSKLIREHLDEYASNVDVERAVQDIGAEYVLILDIGGEWTEDRGWLSTSYIKEQWDGINSINDETPGFDVVLSEGDMRLYQIEQ